MRALTRACVYMCMKVPTEVRKGNCILGSSEACELSDMDASNQI